MIYFINNLETFSFFDFFVPLIFRNWIRNFMIFQFFDLTSYEPSVTFFDGTKQH